MKMKLSLLAASTILAVGMTGCWTENAPTPLEVATVAKALDGYIANATVCIDTDGNQSTCEKTVYSDENGSYTIPVGFTHGTVIISGGNDLDFAPAVVPFTGVLKASASAKVATPLTTLLAEGLTETQITTLLNLPVGIDLTKDYRAAAAVASGTFSETDAKINTAALQVQAILSQITALFSAAGTTKTPAEITQAAVSAMKATIGTSTTTTLANLNLTTVVTAVIKAIPTVNTITASTVASTIATSITNTPIITTTTTLAEAKKATATVITNTATAVQALPLTKAVTLSGNGFNYGSSTATFAQDGKFTATQTISSTDDIKLNFTVNNNGDVLPAEGKLVNLAIQINDTASNRKLKAVIMDVTLKATGISVPAGAILYAEGRDSSGGDTPILVELTNNVADIYSADHITTFNLTNIMKRIEAKVPTDSKFANITKQGTYNISFLIGGVALGYEENLTIKALSAPVTTVNVLTKTTTKSMSGATFTGTLKVN
jgi:hypothetical protein